MHCPLTVRQYRQRLIANLPAVAEWAVERRPPPQLREPGQRRRPVLHASCQQHPTRAFTPTVGQFQFEHIAGTLTRHPADLPSPTPPPPPPPPPPSPVRPSTGGWAPTPPRPAWYSPPGGRPSCPNTPPMPWAARLLC